MVPKAENVCSLWLFAEEVCQSLAQPIPTTTLHLELPGILKEDPFWLWEGVDVPIEMKVAREML